MEINKRIIYTDPDTGIAAVVTPVPNWLAISGNTIEKLALKDVPAGVAFKIVDASDLPSDLTFRDAWEVDIPNPDGIGIGHDAWYNKGS
jgi:hypothetical protein